MKLDNYPFALVDVFADQPLAGNGVSVFLLDALPSAPAMQAITQEMRQFESIFLQRGAEETRFTARIFTMEEELPFAGHPLLGAAAWLHAELFAGQPEVRLEFDLPGRCLAVTCERQGAHYFAEMEQGIAHFAAPLPTSQHAPFAAALGVDAAALEPGLPLQVVSTGLPYLIVPLRSGLERTRVLVSDLAERLAEVGASFVYVFDVTRREGRTWDNAGRVEDIATGSAAGPAVAYLVAHGRAECGEALLLAQGRFLGRPSALHARVRGAAPEALEVAVGGAVCFAGSGVLRLPDGLFGTTPGNEA